MSHRHSRRSFLRFVAGGTAGVVLAACQPAVVEKVVKETVVVEKIVEKEARPAPSQVKIVRVLCDSWGAGRDPL